MRKQDDRESRGITFLHGTSQNLIATAIALAAGAFLGPIVVATWKRYSATPPPDWLQGTVANIAGAVIIAVLVLALGLWSWAARRRGRATPRSKGDRLSIYVASFGDEPEAQKARRDVMVSIVKELGTGCVEVIPAGIELHLTEGISLEDAAADATRKARALLEKKSGALLIWGEFRPDAGRRAVEVRFVSASHDGSKPESFGFTEKFVLEPGFAPELGTALAALAGVQALPAIQDRGRYVAQALIPVAGRLAALIRNFPAAMRPDDRAGLLFSYGLIETAIGEQSGQSERLERAVAAYREALKEWTRERVPLNWALAQNNLGTALSRLGERESGTGRLEEAVGACREALKERTRERVPLDWAATQNNLGNALWSFGGAGEWDGAARGSCGGLSRGAEGVSRGFTTLLLHCPGKLRLTTRPSDADFARFPRLRWRNPLT